MIRSLYVRIVIIFIAAVVGGITVSFMITTNIYRHQLNENMLLPLQNFGQDIALIYQYLPTQEAEQYISNMQQLHTYRITIFDATKQLASYGLPDLEQPSVNISDAQITTVLSGQTVQVNPTGLTTVLFGMPLSMDGNTTAMFIEPLSPPNAPFIKKWIFIFLTYSLLASSLAILIATIFLIRPIKHLTKATEHIAQGQFDVKLNIKQSGEIGTLARSFESMSHDLQQIEQLRKNFVANVSHEIQSPLTTISGYAIALKKKDIPIEKQHHYLDIINSEAKRLSSLSKNLLQLSMLETVTTAQQLQTFYVDEQIRQVIISMEQQWVKKQIHFELQLPPLQIEANPEQLYQVWTNIIGNSIKFSPPTCTITIHLQQTDEQLIVTIRDEGIGIAEKDQAQMFDRFFRADTSRSQQQYEGSGLGLAIVKQIISLHHGQLHTTSTLGKGTTMTVILPLQQTTT
ncbi:sensor histidine kinase [Paenibacillus yanchengensis]|uniref:Heme sensor protein HssS n=1 Tax=Paenibacillus yanchengensis TaxID=2035833 RepID=A0ABW4YLT0_9BACL